MNTEAATYANLKNNLAELKLTQISVNLDTYIDYVASTEKSFIEALKDLTDLELKAKEMRAIQNSVKTSGFPFQKTLDDFDFDFQPSVNKAQIMSFRDMRFVDSAQNILFIGSPGVGKTHLSVGLGIEAAKNHRSSYFISCNDLLSQLKLAKQENRLEQRLKHFTKYKLLIIDEVGFLDIDENQAKLFFQLISKRYEKKSTIITTNKSLGQWGEIFGDAVIANAILDRLLHHSHIIKIVGPSYRAKDLKKDSGNERTETQVTQNPNI